MSKYNIDMYVMCRGRSDEALTRFLEFVGASKTDPAFEWEDGTLTFREITRLAMEDPNVQYSLYRNDSARFPDFAVHYIGDGAVLYSFSVTDARAGEVPFLMKNLFLVLNGDFAFAGAETPPTVDLQDLRVWTVGEPEPGWVIGDPKILLDQT